VAYLTISACLIFWQKSAKLLHKKTIFAIFAKNYEISAIIKISQKMF
jgi:hypothetical protein